MLAAARRQFSTLGYDRTTMRAIAAEAGVDQKLVGYFFGSKQALFVAATALPFEPGASVAAVLNGDPARRGERLAQLVVGLIEDPDAGGRVVGLIRAAAAEDEAARMVREMFTAEIWSPAAAALPVEDPALAVSLIATHLIGLLMTRYVIGVEPLASLPAERIVELLAPLLQRHLTEVHGGGQGPPAKASSRSKRSPNRKRSRGKPR